MASLPPPQKFRAFTAGGNGIPVRPLVGGKLYTYEAGTTMPKVTYTDATETTPNTNPVILNNRGEADVWLGLGSYKFVLTDADDVQQSVTDGIKSAGQYLEEAIENNAASDTALRADLANKLLAGKGAGMVGYARTLAYEQGTVGRRLKDLPASANDGDLAGDGATNDTVKLNAMLASGAPVDLGSKTYAVNDTITFRGPVYSSGATLKFIGNVIVALDLGANTDLSGRLNVDVSTVTCTAGVRLNGAEQCTHASAQRTDMIYVKGKSHTDSLTGLLLDATVPGAENKAWVHYAKMRRIIVENFKDGASLKADNTTLALSYVNANIIDEITLIGCKRFLLLDAQGSASEVASNFIQRYVFQYGAVAGSFPTTGIQLTGRCLYNHIEGFIFDWDHANTSGALVFMDSGTADNDVLSSAFSWEVRDLGRRNRYHSALEPSTSTTWLSPFGRDFIGEQDNCLAHWTPGIGTLTSAATTTGTAICNLATGALTDLQKENDAYTGIAFAAGSGVASYAIEFRSTTNPINGVAVVGAYFEPGYIPQQIAVQIDTGAGYVERAAFSDVQSSDVFCRLDAVAGTDIYNGVLGIKFIVRGSDTRNVRIRQVYASGIAPRSFVSRGGDRINGDIAHAQGTGPVIRSPDGTEWRILVSNAGVLSTLMTPTKILTYF